MAQLPILEKGKTRSAPPEADTWSRIQAANALEQAVQAATTKALSFHQAVNALEASSWMRRCHSRIRSSVWKQVGVATGATSAALLLRVPLYPLLEYRTPFITFFAATAVTASLGGVYTGMLTTILGAVTALVFRIAIAGDLSPLTVPMVGQTAIFLIIGAGMSYMSEFMHREQKRMELLSKDLILTGHQLRRLNRDLEYKIEKRTDELRKSLEWFKSIMQSLPLPALAQDAEGRILFVNALFVELWELDLRPEQIAGMKTLELLPIIAEKVMDTEGHVRQVRELLQDHGKVLAQEIRLRNQRVILRDLVPIENNGAYIGQLFLYRDVTQERRVDRAKSEFMSLASHQLRTPLTAIRWSMGRLRKAAQGRLPDADLQLVEVGRTGSARLSATIDAMLMIARIEMGEMRPSVTCVRLADLVKEQEKLSAWDIQEREQRLVVFCPADLEIPADPALLREIVSNLVSNAVKYTPRGGTVTVTVRRQKDAVHLLVSDTGVGIPKFQQKHIFQKFFRGDNATSLDPNGSGLGLYLVAKLVELLGGHISFQSTEGKGTTFTVVLRQ